MKFDISTVGCIILISMVLTPCSAGSPEASSPGRPPVLCFAPGTPDWYVQQAIATASLMHEHHSLAGGGEPEFQFPDGNRWYRTATDGSGLGQGDPTTLTWSVIPDGTTIPGYAGEPDAPSNLRAYLTGIYGSEAVWLSLLQQVFDRWSELSGITYVYEPGDDGGSFVSSEGSIGNRGDIRIGGHNIDGNSGILAYNFYPDVGDMVIDTGDSFYTNTSDNSLRLRNVVAHEHGHGLGVQHVCPVNQTKLMEPYYSGAFDGPQHDDILAVNRGYGDDCENNDDPASAEHLPLSVGSISVHDISIDNNYDVDDFSFTVGSDSSLTVSVTPVGWTYLSGPQASGGSCTPGTDFDSLNVHDLALRVLDRNGITELASSNVNGVGMPETITNVPLSSGSGTYYVEVEGDSTDQAQLYRLDLSVSGGPVATPTPTPTQVPPTPTFTRTPTNTPVPPTPTPTPTQVPPTPTFTRTPTNTSVPPTPTSTPTQVPPTPTFTPSWTPTPPPSSTPTPTRTPSPTPTPPEISGQVPTPVTQPVIFQDGFESGDLSAWSRKFSSTAN